MKRRILLTTLTVATIAVVVFGVPLGIVVRHQYRNEAIVQLERRTIDAAWTIDNGATQGSDLAELPVVVGTKLALYRPDGLLLAGDGPALGGDTVAAAASNRIADYIGDDGIVVTVPIVSDEQVVSVLRAERGPSAFESVIWRAWMVMAGLALTAVVVAALVANRLARRLSRPLDRVHDAAMKLGEGDFTVSVEPCGIAELDDVGTALASTATRLGNQIARERTFSADVSHQLRTPLTGLRLVLETEKDYPRPDRNEVFDDALREVDRLERTIDDLLSLARNASVDRQPLDLTTILTETQSRWLGRAAAAGRRVVADIEPSDDHVAEPVAPKASSAAVINILDVLVDNALRHGQGDVTISLRGIDGGVVVSVSDEGAGIRGDGEEVFQRRQRTAGSNSTARQRPHGIGLALARSLAEAEGDACNLQQSNRAPDSSSCSPRTAASIHREPTGEALTRTAWQRPLDCFACGRALSRMDIELTDLGGWRKGASVGAIGDGAVRYLTAPVSIRLVAVRAVDNLRYFDRLAEAEHVNRLLPFFLGEYSALVTLPWVLE